MGSIFISYSRLDQEIVKTLVEDLKALGNDVWFDQTLTGGQRWWNNILDNIRERDIFVFAISPESLDSEACKNELNYVEKLGKAILPVLISDKVKVNLLPHPLSDIQVTDYRHQDKKTAFALIKAISGLPASPPLPDPLPEQPPVPVSYLSTLKEQIETEEPLGYKEQVSLVFQLKASLGEGRSPDEIYDLLLCLKQRNDLLAKVAVEIDPVLDSIKKKLSMSQNSERPGIVPKGSSPPSQGDSEMNLTYPSPPPPKGAIHCFECGSENRHDAKYCRNCGKPLSTEEATRRKGVKSRKFICPPDGIDKLITDLRFWLEGQDFTCQNIPTEENEILLQVVKKGSWRKFVGMETALNVLIRQKENMVTVEIGAGNWIDKAAVGTASVFVLWPLAVTAGIGAWQQMKLPEEIFDFIGSKLAAK